MELADYMALDYPMEVVPDLEEGGYTVSFPDLPGCATCVQTFEEAGPMAREAREVWTRAALEDGLPIALPGQGRRFSGEFRIRLPRSLHGALVEDAARDNVSLNQLCVALLAEGHGRRAVAAR